MKTRFPEWITTQYHTGSVYPFYNENDKDNQNFTFNIEDLLIKIPPEKRNLELSSIIEILHKGYIFGDNTLVKGVKRTPWMARLNEHEDWEYKDIAEHRDIKIQNGVAMKVKDLLYEELLNAIGKSKSVGILLSGGLDSRIIAGILKEAELTGDYNGEVVVYNWGMDNSRDIIYAKKIAELYNWKYIHYSITPETLKENFYNSMMLGAEISPVHLHRMTKVRDDINSEIVIAGTYGDSLGRGLYSGTHVSNLKSLMEEDLNKLGLLKDNFIREHALQVNNHYFQYQSNLRDKKKPFQLREVEQNIHYLRRLLATAMSIIAQKKPIFQMFTNPKIVDYIWGLDASIRDDRIYKEILKVLPSQIGSIPYAKTGKSFIDSSVNKTDDYFKSYHRYGIWMREELREFIKTELDLDLLFSLDIFNEKSIEKIYKLWPKATTHSLNKIDITISWLTAFSMFIKKHGLNSNEKYKSNFKDTINTYTVIPKIKGYYMLREKIGK